MATLEVDGLVTRLGQLGLEPIPQFPEAHPLTKPLDIGRAYLAEIICSLMNCEPTDAYDSIQWPNDIFTGDLTIPLPKLSRIMGTTANGHDPDKLALELLQKFPDCPLFIKPLQDGVHLRIMFLEKTLARLLLYYIDDRKESYGKDLSNGLRNPSAIDAGSKKLVIEFSSPNIGGEFHGKHLRSTILGAFIANIYENMGWDVVRMNYLGDWGKQVGLLGAGWARFSSEEEFRADPMHHMLSVYSKIDELFQPEVAASRAARDKKEDTATIEDHGIFAERNLFFKHMEDGDEKTIDLWKRFREETINYYARLYASMNVKFDEYSGESQVSTQTMDDIEEMLKSKGISEESEGAWVVDFQKHKAGSGRAIIRDRNGSRTYQLRELASVLDRFKKYAFDKMICVVADDHNMHFSRTIKILDLLDMADIANKLDHVPFNKGSHMSEKLGTNQMLGDILDKCKSAMHDSLATNPERAAVTGDSEESAAKLGISALQTQELSARKATDHSFDLEYMTAFARGTGPELQYWYMRLESMLNGATPALADITDDDYATIEEGDFFELLRILVEYPDITSAAYKSMEPSTVISYLNTITDQLELCFNPSDEEEDVEDEEIALNSASEALIEATRLVLQNGMRLLGIMPTPPTKTVVTNGVHV